MTTSPFLAEAIAIGDRLAADAIHARGSATWVSRAHPEVPNPAKPRALAFSAPSKLFDGTAGIGLFLGRLSQLSGDDNHRQTAVAALRHAVHGALDELALPDGSHEHKGRFGFYAGALGVAFAAAELAKPLDAPELLEHSRGLVRRLAKTTSAPRHEDLIFGSAGAIPTLLSLAEGHGFDEARPLAVSIGDALVKSATRRDKAWAWTPMNPKWHDFLTGFSHGAAGFAYGLATLYEATGTEDYRIAAEGAIEHERLHFIEPESNWGDLRNGPDAQGVQRHVANWCHGAPGIALSRVLLHPILKDDQLLAEARIGARTTERDVAERLDKPGSNFMLCHGVAGNAETLLLIEQALGVPDAIERAREVGRYGIERYGTGARKRWDTAFVDWPTGIPGTTERSMMKGITGIGYFLLRLHAPQQVPTFLIPGQRWGQ